MSWFEDLAREPWRFDFFTVLRQFERINAQKPRIGEGGTLGEEFVRLGQDPYLEFPAANLDSVERRADGTARVLVRFLGLLGPQGALPVATTAQALAWRDMRDDAFPRFLDILNHRFLELFFRAWADSRPIAQHERPAEDRFGAYVGSAVGLGRPMFLDLDTVPDAQKLAHAGLMGAAAKSAVRLEALFRGVLSLDAGVEEFVGVRLPVEVEDRSRLGRRNASLGVDAMVGATFFSVSDKISIRIRTADMAEYERLLPRGSLAEPIVDLVLFYLGEAVDWDVVPVIPTRAIEPTRLGRNGALGWTSWLPPAPAEKDTGERADARFNLAERVRRARARRAAHQSGKGGR